MKTYPRLPPEVASDLLGQLTGLAILMGPEALRQRAATTHARMTWYPTALRHSDRHLLKIQRALRDVGERHGFPQPLASKSGVARAFDQDAADVLYKQLEIAPIDAAQEGVWSFISLVLVPDVAFWRWPNTGDRTDYERLIGRPRNVFRRLWWRAYCLGPEATRDFYEDEAVAILERTTLGGDPRVARVCANRHLLTVAEHPEITQRTNLLRHAAKHFLRLSRIVTLQALDDKELESLVAQVFDSVVFALADNSG